MPCDYRVCTHLSDYQRLSREKHHTKSFSQRSDIQYGLFSAENTGLQDYCLNIVRQVEI